MNKLIPNLRTIFLVVFTLISYHALAQVRFKTDNLVLGKKIDSILNLPETKLVSDDIFRQKLDSVLNTASGFTYKDGKAAKTSATLDDKSFTFNLNVIDRSQASLQLNVSGTGEDSFVDLVKDGKYKHTLSYGATLNWFPAINSASFPKTDQSLLARRLARIHSYFENKARLNQAQDIKDIETLNTLLLNKGELLLSDEPIPLGSKDYDQDLAKYQELVKKFSNYLPEDFNKLSIEEKRTAVKLLQGQELEVIANYHLQQEIDSLNNYQLSAKFSTTYFHWFTFGAKYNTAKQPIFDGTAAEDLYTGEFIDNHVSFSAAYNFLIKRNKFNFWFAPVLRFANKRDFDDDNKVSINVPKGIAIVNGTSTTEYQQTSYSKIL